MASVSIDLGDDEGFGKITMNGSEQRLDLGKVQGMLKDYHQNNLETPEVEYTSGMSELIAGLGFPAPSHLQTFRFFKRINEVVDELAKKNESSPASPGSTA